jgi:hypothetical protein
MGENIATLQRGKSQRAEQGTEDEDGWVDHQLTASASGTRMS